MNLYREEIHKPGRSTSIKLVSSKGTTLFLLLIPDFQPIPLHNIVYLHPLQLLQPLRSRQESLTRGLRGLSHGRSSG